jgi:hypothetical protein
MSHLLTSGPSGMVFEHLWDYFQPKNSTNGFPQLFQLSSPITQGHIPFQIPHVFGTTHLLTMTKPIGGVHPIVATHKLHFMPSISQKFCNTFFSTPIWSYN